MITFSVTEIYLLLYSVIFAARDVEVCESQLDLKNWASIFLWLVTKAFSCLIWVYAIMYILWPRKLTLTSVRRRSEVGHQESTESTGSENSVNDE